MTTLQQLLDGPDMDIDLNGQSIVCHNVIASVAHSGKTIRNGTFEITPNAAIANFMTCQNVSHAGVFYPAGQINLTFDNITWSGTCNFNYGLQEHNEYVADRLGCGSNAFTTKSTRAGHIVFNNCRAQYLGNSFATGWFDSLTVRNLVARRVAKHVLGIRECGGCTAIVDDIDADECGNVVDFHGEGGLFPNADVARFTNINVRNCVGRNKVSGRNWNIEMTNCSFVQDSVVNMNTWPGFDLSRNPRRFLLDDWTVVNFPLFGFSARSDTVNQTVPPTVQLHNLAVTNSMFGVRIQAQRMGVYGSQFSGCYARFSGQPFEQTGNDDVGFQPPQYWAMILDQINNLYAAKNAEWGTSYQSLAYGAAPTAIKDLMETR